MTRSLTLAVLLTLVVGPFPAGAASAPLPASAGTSPATARAGTASAPRRAEAPAKPTVLDVRRPAAPEWFGVYLMGKKAGYSSAWVGLEVRGGRKVLVARSSSTISATVGTRTVQRSQSDEKVYEARPSGRLLSFTSQRSGDGGDRSVAGTCTADQCVAILSAQGQREERRIRVQETAEQADAARLAVARKASVLGEQLELEGLRVKKVEDRYVGTTVVAGGGVEAHLLVAEELEVGDRAATRVSIAPDGRIVEMRLGDSVVAKAEAEQTAKRLDKVDLFGMTRVKLPAVPDRTVPGRLVYRLKGVPKEFQVSDPRQVWTAGSAGPGDAVTLTVTATTPAAADPTRDGVRSPADAKHAPEFLEATPEVDWDAPSLRQLAREVVGNTRGVYAASTKLVHFVYRRLEKAYGVSRDRATEVLQVGKGDCTEHALLFTALARAAGIPARQVHGLVFAQYDDSVPALYWHAWVEVRSGDEWIAVDPTFDQPVADPTHIVFGRGSQVDTVGLLGALQVLGVERAPLTASR